MTSHEDLGFLRRLLATLGRALEDYLRRNPDYRDTYEAEFQRRYHVYLPPVAGAPAGCEQRRSGGAEPASPPGERRQKEAQPLEKVW